MAEPRVLPDLARVGLSLPCTVPVVPGTPDAAAPIDERTETCNVDAWWIIGRAPICHRHLEEALGADLVHEFVDQLAEQGHDVPNDTEELPWEQQHRYPQHPQSLPVGHPVRDAWEPPHA